MSPEEAQLRKEIDAVGNRPPLAPFIYDEQSLPDPMAIAAVCRQIAGAGLQVPESCKQSILSLSVTVAPTYIWGAGDVINIGRQLGYTAQQIPAHCQLRLDGQITGADQVFMSRIYAGQRQDIKYANGATTASFTPRAVCDMPSGTLPQEGGMIARVGNKLSVVLLNRINCPIQNKKALTVQYKGDGVATCN